MIDCENEVYSKVKTALTEAFDKINVTSDYVNSPSSFPHVSITMSDNYTLSYGQSSKNTEDFSAVMFEINVHSNKRQGKKTECKSIMKVIDETLYKMNFKRTALTPVPNLEDATIYRLVARYSGLTDGINFYRR